MSEHLLITILHIDDNEPNRYVVSRMLRNAQFNVLEAATGKEGLELLTQQRPDVIILDVKLPDIDGFDVCRQIKSNPHTATIPVVFLSANYVQSQDKAYGLEAGADGYLIQPVEAVELIATVKALWRMRQAEESALRLAREWQTTFDAMNYGVCLLKQHGQVIRCNSSMTEILKQPCSKLAGRSHGELTQMLSGSTDLVAEPDLFTLIQQTLHRESREFQSGEKWFCLILDPIFDEQGRFAGAVYIVTDISERKQAEEERTLLLACERSARTEAEAANRLKDEFLATLSHELRSPLNAMLGWSHLLNSQNINPTVTAKAMETIEQSAKVQAQLVEDLLDVSQMIRGKLHIDFRPVDLVSPIQAALKTIYPAAKAKEIQIEAILDSKTAVVAGDKERLQQIFWNLLSNAVKFTPRGGYVQVRLLQTDKTVEVIFTDTGQGIHSDFLAYVFDRFRQADGSTTRPYGGLGLGLAIVRHLVELHGGTVMVDSAGVGQGATFSVILLRNQENGETDEPETREEDNSLSSSILGGVRVLVVDNDEDQRDFLKLALEMQGAEVIVVSSPTEALAEISQCKPDVLVSDIGMPEEDGYSLISKVRKLAPDKGGEIPAIALTAYARVEDAIEAISAGFQMHISKPLDPDELAKAIATLK
jgi:PAS domain S-box-containing protein